MSWSGNPVTTNGQGDFAAAQVAYAASCDSQNRRAARVVAGRSADAEDCAEMLAMLGLDAAEDRDPIS